MLKRTLLQALVAGTALAFTGFGALAQNAFDGPTSGPRPPRARPSSCWRAT